MVKITGQFAPIAPKSHGSDSDVAACAFREASIQRRAAGEKHRRASLRAKLKGRLTTAPKAAITMFVALIAFATTSVALPSDALAQSAEVEDALYSALADRLPWPGTRFDVSDVRVQGDLPRGDWWLELAGSDVPRGRVRARVIADEPTRRPVWVAANVTIEVPALIADRAIPAGAEVADYTRVELRDISDLPRDFATDADLVNGLVARRALREGNAVRTSQLEAPQLVERNQIVVIEVSRGAITITDRGVALEPGRDGETIQVRSMSSDEVVTAMVRDLGRVVIP